MAGKNLQLFITPRAENSFELIADYYLTLHSADRAVKVINSIEDAFDKICNFPLSYPVCFDVERPASNVRQIIVHNTFKIIYRITKERIEIIEIFHGKRNPALIKDIDK